MNNPTSSFHVVQLTDAFVFSIVPAQYKYEGHQINEKLHPE
jgi:hypothetical protein